jgi:molybdopterin/thiamine biosynthesis adenylyltransferase
LKSKIVDAVLKHSTARQFPDETPYTGLSIAKTLKIAASLGVTGREIELAALENEIIPERYARNMKTFTPQDQAALLQSRVSVIGLGGFGGTVTEILARIGIGTLNLVDGDSFEDSNLNRQLLSRCDLLTTPKVKAAVERIQAINPSIAVVHHLNFLNAKNSSQILQSSDVAVDCLDNLKTRFILEDACKKKGFPLVSAAVAGTAGHVTTIFPEDQGLSLIYGPPQNLPIKGAEASLGTLPYTVTLLAALECAEVVKVILNNGSLLRNKLLLVDLAEGTFDTMRLQ